MINRNTALILLPVFWPNLPPLSLAALKGFLVSKGIDVDVIDFNNYFFNEISFERKKQWRKSCNRYFENNIVHILKSECTASFNYMIEKLLSYDVIGFSCYKSNFPATQEIARILKEKNPKIKIIFGGPEITRQYFKLNGGLTGKFGNISDFFVIGEGELPLMNYLTEEKLDNKIAEFQELENLDSLPAPDYSDYDINKYPKKSSISIMYSRGCVKNCRFCSERLLYKKYRLCSVDNVIDQIKNHKKKGIGNFIFHDSLINGNIDALELLCDEIINNFGSIKWEAQIAIRQDMPDRLFGKIKDSGCYNLFVGLESGCDNTLHNMNKGFTTEEALGFFEKLKFSGISFGVSIITGFPGETHKDFIDSLDFIIEHKNLISKIEQVNPYVYYDGTNLPVESEKESIERALFFMDRVKDSGLRYTNAFILNLVEPR